ncbi:hypothetical protein HY416_01090 [Candidatus Kaiserbacteria bacterium]|nr:hypothetical protein [Candidatus Kaiserbacteria bacterium]
MKRPFLERLREKPKEFRVQMSFLGALCVTGVVVVLWGVTLPARMQVLSEHADPLETEPGTELKNFFSDTRDNLGQLIGASGETPASPEEAPFGDAGTYREGTPSPEEPSYGESSFQEKPVVMPVDRREVLIGTTTGSD